MQEATNLESSAERYLCPFDWLSQISGQRSGRMEDAIKEEN